MIDTAWHYRIFFSVDIEDSTSFKYSKIFKTRDDCNDATSADWQWGAVFREFFDSFIDAFFSRNKTFADEHSKNGIDFQELDIWKFLGDEIIFVVEVTDVRAVLWHVLAFKNAIKFYNENEKDCKGGLKCKGTIWGAGFPINNFPLGSNDYSEGSDIIAKKKSALKNEYVGANIDAGFRLTKFSSPRNMVISIEIAYFVSKSWVTQPSPETMVDRRFPSMKYDGMKTLKGIFFNKPYPVFYIDLQYQVPPHEDKWLGTNVECEPKDVIDFCQHFFEKATFFSEPFIANDKAEVCNKIPPEMRDRRDALENGLKMQDYDPRKGDDGAVQADITKIDDKLACVPSK